MAFTAADVMALRERTGVGMMDCKKALTETDGDMERAADLLREKGLAAAQKKAGRIAAEGVVESYIHMGGKIGVLVEINCETDFVAKNEGFKSMCHDIAMHIAAYKPQYITRDEVPAADIEHEKSILREQALLEGKPEKIVDKMVEGRIAKFYDEYCLLDQAFLKNQEITVGDYINENVARIGEKISVRRFTRYEMGEGLEKRKDDFAAEVAAQSAGK